MENADANLFERDGASLKLVEDPKLAAEAKRHQERVKKNVEEVGFYY